MVTSLHQLGHILQFWFYAGCVPGYDSLESLIMGAEGVSICCEVVYTSCAISQAKGQGFKRY